MGGVQRIATSASLHVCPTSALQPKEATRTLNIDQHILHQLQCSWQNTPSMPTACPLGRALQAEGYTFFRTIAPLVAKVDREAAAAVEAAFMGPTTAIADQARTAGLGHQPVRAPLPTTSVLTASDASTAAARIPETSRCAIPLITPVGQGRPAAGNGGIWHHCRRHRCLWRCSPVRLLSVMRRPH